LLFWFLVVVAPVWDYFATRRLKRAPSSHAKLRYYQVLCAWLWISALVACVAAGLRPVLTIRVAPAEASWLLANTGVRLAWDFLLVVFLGLVLSTGMRALWRRHSPAAIPKQLNSLSYFLPSTTQERRWWIVVCLTAGFCEEVLFRGFVIHYLHSSGFALGYGSALAISAAIFGLQHLYQGTGAFSTVITGLVLGVLFMVTGSLLLPILFHAAFDLQVLLILPTGASADAAAA
jgi:membrane protease YdiL (CAAX protease family)